MMNIGRIGFDSDQLLLIQRGETFSIKNSTGKIRLVDDAFRRQVQELELALIGARILAEIAAGRVIIEIKDTDGKVTAVTSKALAGHEKAKKYEKIEVQEDSYFEELAKTVQEGLEAATQEASKFNNEQKKAEADLQKKTPDTRSPLPFVTPQHSREARDDHFIQAPGIKKITQKMVEDAIEFARRSQEHKLQEQKQHKRKRERQIDRDNRLFERNKDFQKISTK